MDTTTVIPDDLITTGEAARLARCHVASVYRWILRKPPRLRSWRRAGRLFVSRAELLGLFRPAAGRPAETATAQTEADYERWVEKTLREKGFKV
jgi:hypothetical protein